MRHGVSVDRIGPDGHSWVDVKAVHDNLLPTDSAYYRARFPDTWFWADIQTRLLGKVATATEKVHYLLAAQVWETVPEPYGWAEYGPAEQQAERSAADVEDAAASAAKARAVAAELLAEAFG